MQQPRYLLLVLLAGLPLAASVGDDSESVALTLGSSVIHSQNVTLAYNPVSRTPSLQDLAGNPAATFSRQTVTNLALEPVYDTDADGLIEISTLAQLDAMRHDLDGNGVPTTDGAAAYAAAFPTVTQVVCRDGGSGQCEGYELLADLDFDTNGNGEADAGDAYWNDGAGWAAIGGADSGSWSDRTGPRTPFLATFEGNGYAITRLFIDTRSSLAGLFGYSGADGVIRNVQLSDITLTGDDAYVGGLVGWNAGSIETSSVTGSISGSDIIGGLVGENRGTITASHTTARVVGDDMVGGLVGRSYGTITASSATGRVSGEIGVGGLVGSHKGTITSSYSTAHVSGESSRLPIFTGGLVGDNRGTITNSYATGRVTGGRDVGGLVGSSILTPSIIASYATGSVTGERNVGGLVGSSDTPGIIAASYATGRVMGETHVGGLVGNNAGTITASYWDMTTSGQTTSAGGTGKTTTALQVPTDYSGVYADWNINQDRPWRFGMSSQYPALKGNFDREGAETWQEFGYQLRAGPTLTATATPGQVVLNWTAVDVSHWSPAPTVAFTLYRENGTTSEILAEDLADRQYTDSDVPAGTFTYQVAAVVDGGEATRSGRVAVHMAADLTPNVQPMAADDTAMTDEDTAVTIPVVANDTDPEGGTLSAPTIAAAPSHGQAAVQTDGTITYTPAPDYHGPDAFTYTVSASVHQSAPATVFVTVRPVNDPPTFEPTLPRAIAETAPTGTEVGMPVVATDVDEDSLSYTLGGPDGVLFAIGEDTGQITVEPGSGLDYETRQTYTVEVTATDPSGESAMVEVTISVTNADEAGTVSLFPAQPRVGTVLRATLIDPDGAVRSVTWRWARSADKANWTNVSATSTASYTPVDRDRGKYLRARATYTDGEGAGKTAEMEVDMVVGERAPAPELSIIILVSGLSIPWGLAFTPDGTLLFTERGGKLSSRLTDGTVQTVSANLSDLFAGRSTGLMSIVVDPDFASNRRFYTCQGHTGPEVQVISWTIDATYTTATRVDDPLVEGILVRSDGLHSGGRMRFGPDGYLWLTTGDAGTGTVPQDLDALGGKILRVDATTGAGAPGNPFALSPLIYTYGHRNAQGLAFRPGTRQMWVVEHGPDVDDEINLLTTGGNYGWDPVPNDDQDPLYNELEAPMTDLVKFPDAVEAKWSSGDPTLAPGGGIFLEDGDWDEWDGRLAVATLKTESLRVFEFTDDGAFVSQVVVPELDKTYGRLRTPILGPDGALYVTTSNGNSRDKILKVIPSQPPTFPAATDTQAVAENSSRSTVVATVEATDPDGDSMTYTLSGPDAETFDIDTNGHITVGEGTVLELEITGLDRTYRLEAAYGTARADTAATAAGEALCGDTDNGFGLLFNWNLLGDGVHTVRALADGAEFGRATFTVTTLGEEFMQGIAEETVVEDFPSPGEEVRLIWQQANQNFVLAPLR